MAARVLLPMTTVGNLAADTLACKPAKVGMVAAVAAF